MSLKTALISVSDKTGLVELAKGLRGLGFQLLCTSGSGKYLSDNGIEVVSIESYTGQNEILDGRVKTLHPKIHAGLLAKRDNPTHMRELSEAGIFPIDVAVINLYPFIKSLETDAAADPKKMVELVDIGGPTMIRAAAKNFSSVIPLIDPADYSRILELLSKGSVPMEIRRQCSVKVFTAVANYNLEIARYFSKVRFDEKDIAAVLPIEELPEVDGMVLVRQQALRYGENPHQQATLYGKVGAPPSSWIQHGGKELSYNNLLDIQAALELIRSLKTDPAAVIIKHLNPCGVATGATILEALKRAKQCDPRSHFGGIVALNREVTAADAEELAEGFVEIVVAPKYSTDGMEALRKKKNVRIMEIPLGSAGNIVDYRSIDVGVLVQTRDLAISDVKDLEVASIRKPSADELRELDFAWNVSRSVKSNAIVLAKDSKIIGVGAGQMSRIDSTEVAIMKAKTHGHSIRGAVCASDAFFPFPDSVERLIFEGVTAFIVPGGAKRDDEALKVANDNNAVFIFAPDRHFKH